MDISLCAKRLGGKTYVWDVAHLIDAARDIAPERRSIGDFDLTALNFFGSYEDANVRSFIGHMQRVESADLSIPIILATDGTVLDGLHRLAQAVKSGATSVFVVQLVEVPPPLAVIEHTA